MIFSKLVQKLASGEIANHITPSVLKFCEEFFNDSFSDSNKALEKLAFNGLRKSFYSDPSLRERLVTVASIDEAGSMLLKASEAIGYCADKEDQFFTERAYDLLIYLFDNYISDTSLVDYLLGFTDQYVIERQQEVGYINRINPDYGMYSYQLDVISQIREIYSKSRRCLLHLPTGAGKTRTAINYICEFLREDESRLVLWLADRNELCEQALDEFNKAWCSLGNQAITSYGYFGSSGNLTLGGIDKGFLVCGTQGLWALRNSQRDILYRILAEKTSLIVFDEAHKAAANTYSEMIDFILDANKQSNLLGLTATPGRKISEHNVDDDENAYLASIFGGNKITMSVNGYLSPIQYLFEKNYLATPEFIDLNYSDDTVLTNVSGGILNTDAINALSDSELRNRAILECVRREVDSGGYVIVFANTVEHARNLEGLFQVSGINAMSVDAQTKERSNIIGAYRRKEINVLINFDVLTAGFDAPHTNVAVIARPTSSLVAYSQMAGRAMRGGEKGNKTCKIYTVNDDIPEFRSVARAFTHWDRYWTSE